MFPRSRCSLRNSKHRIGSPAPANGAPVLEDLTTWPSANARAWVTRFCGKVCPSENTSALVVIGSVARNLPSVNDVDLLYVYKGSHEQIKDHPLDVDVRLFSADRVEDLISSGNDLIGWALR